jgi:hypothetical protein
VIATDRVVRWLARLREVQFDAALIGPQVEIAGDDSDPWSTRIVLG